MKQTLKTNDYFIELEDTGNGVKIYTDLVISTPSSDSFITSLSYDEFSNFKTLLNNFTSKKEEQILRSLAEDLGRIEAI